jgi:3-deoxy-D-manno-octulosonic-acid transferase
MDEARPKTVYAREPPFSRLALLGYSGILSLGLVLGTPFWLFRIFTSGRYREGLGQRLGRLTPALREAVSGRRVIWLHAVSVGEVLAVERLIGELRQALPEHILAVSTTTGAAQKLAQQRFAELPIFFFPLDFAFAVRAYLRALQPELVILVESELWPRFLAECAWSSIPVAVVNARVSDRSFRRTKRWRGLWRRMTAGVSVFLSQGEETADRLRRLGIAPDRIQVPGNLKLDPPAAAANAMTARLEARLAGLPLIVCGSTLDGEERAVLAAWPEVLAACPKAVLLIAPRHPDRFAAVEALLQAGTFPVQRCSQLGREAPAIEPGTILLLDTLGDLASVYSLAAVAFVGGSLIPRGGHNPLEATRFGVPVLMGESYENFREIVTELLAAGAVRLVTEASLAPAFVEGLQTPRRAHRPSPESGATARTVGALLRLLEAPR